MMCAYLRLSIIIVQICVSCGYDSNFMAHDKTSVNLKEYIMQILYLLNKFLTLTCRATFYHGRARDNDLV